MTKDELIAKHPRLLTNVACGVYVGDGWCPMLDVLCRGIENHCDRAKVALPTVAQVKEKFGGLRFYVDGGDTYVHSIIDFAEALSFRICEDCGNAGKLRDDRPWYRTLCDEHAAARARMVKPVPE